LERSRIILWVLVLIAAGVIIWWVGFHSPSLDLAGIDQKAGAQPGRVATGPNEPNFKQTATPFDPNAPQTAKRPEDANQPAGSDANQPAQAQAKPGAADANAPGKPGETKPAEAKASIPEDPNDPLEAVNLKDVEMKNIVEKIAQWTGKTVIPADEAMKQKITIYAPDKLPRSKALTQIYSALRMKGYSPEETEGTIFLKPLSEARLGMHPVVGPDQPLAAFENSNQIVQKPFKLTYYPPAQMGEIIRPLMGEYAHVAADATTGTLLVIDTVGNLLRVEKIIAQFDVPDAGNKMVTEIFEIHSGDPTEMVQLLRLLLGGSADSRRGGQLRTGSRSRPSSTSSGGGKSGGGGATFVVIGEGETPIYLIPEAKRKVIIARGSADSIRQIGEWIGKLDQEQQVAAEYETVSLVYADADEVARRIQQSLEQMPGTELRPNVLVQPLAQSRQVMIFGRADLREMIKKLIAEVDIMPGQRLTEVFELAHADPDQIKTNIEGLYETEAGSMSSYSYRSYRYRNVQPSETVKVVSYPTMQRVTVIASPENMEKIREQIKGWDVPLNVEQVRPRIIELKNSDPVKMAQLLSKLFTEESDSSSSLFRMLWYGFDDASQKKKIVGPLYGQLTFEEVPGTKKIIIISKIPQAYEVIEQIVYELDRQEMAEVPKVVQLQYADPEDLSERLNAMFNEPGTLAPIRRTARGLGDYSMDQPSSGNQSGGQNRNDGGNNAASNPGEYTPWWSRGARRTLDEEPLSNVVGRVRFVPDPRSKSILVLSPPEFHADIEKTIRQLDVPGMQVMIKATVVEVNHSALTSLGVQLATNSAAFGTLEENAVTALGNLTSLATHGSAAPASTPIGAQGTGSIVGGTSNVYALIDFLIKHVNAKILNEQTLWTKDNEEASFFKGSNVAFVGGTSTTGTGIQTSSFTFEEVGMTLAVRPSITPEKNVDMIVNIILSQLTGDFVNGQPVRTKMDTRTNMIVADSETLMLGGILFQEKTRIKRKLPLLGDLPLIGGLFQHNSNAISNNEMIVFITPYVVSDGMEVSGEAQTELGESQESLQKAREELGAAAEALRQQMDEE